MTTHSAEADAVLVTRLHLPVTSDADAFGTTARTTGRVVVVLPEPGAGDPGGLDRLVIAAVESELGRRGAAPPGFGPDDELDAKLGDQLYRTRLLGAGGLALRFSRLDVLADAAGRLSPEDSNTLRQLFVLAERESLQLYLPETLARLRVFGEPQRLSDWLSAGSKAGRIASIEYESPNSSEVETVTRAKSAGDPSLLPPCIEAFSPALCATPGRADDSQIQRCSAWAALLEGMSGPKVHASVERAFLTAYLPLRREVATGRAPLEAQAAVDQWAEEFAHSYSAAFKTLHARTRRPRMVKDVVELGMTWLGRYHARQCQLLLVSGMRFDLGQRLNEEVERHLVGRAVSTDQAILWSALPSNPESEGLGDAPLSSRRSNAEPVPETRAAHASQIESVRVGTRELFRLQQVKSEVAQPGDVESVRLHQLATALAESVVPWMREQPAETLIVIFGDRGFRWHTTERGTSAAQWGGALPEQVLVPASAWLVGGRAKTRLAPGVH